MDGFFPKEIVVFNVPVESWRETTGDRAPLGDDFGEYCSTFRNWSAIIIFLHRFLPSQLHKTAPTGAQWCHLCYWRQFIKSRMIGWSQKTEHGPDPKMQQRKRTLFEWCATFVPCFVGEALWKRHFNQHAYMGRFHVRFPWLLRHCIHNRLSGCLYICELPSRVASRKGTDIPTILGYLNHVD